MPTSPRSTSCAGRRSLAAVVFFCGLSVAASALADPPPAYAPGPMLQKFLAGPMVGVEEIIFAERVSGRDHWYVNFGNYADFSPEPRDRAYKEQDGVLWGYGDGGRLCRMNLRTGELKTLLDDPAGGVRDPQVHYDGQKILFSYRKGGEHPFHLYEINIDGTGLKQLTDGPDDDIEPIYCPDGGIIFCSSRCRRFVNCWFTRVATLYRCDGDGKNVRMLSSNNDHDNTPAMLPDGRVLYMRWEYVDRSQVHFHHLWTMNPDGTGQMVCFGNMTGGVAMLDAKPIPGTDKVVASFSPGHGQPEHTGWITIVDPKLGPDALAAARHVSQRAHWRDPYAFSEDCFLVARGGGIFVMDGEGAEEIVYVLPEAERRLECHEPQPLRPRPREAVLAPRVNLSNPTGRLVLEDIYHGRNMAGVERGAIKRLLVLQQLPKPVNFSGGMEPLTIGGSFTLAEVLGTVPVEADGSAYMELPALRSLFFVALDENNVSVKRMHSFLVLQPGETTSCVGCHEQRVRTPLGKTADLAAMRRSPSPIEPIAGVPRVLDFPRDVQPILDRHCVECHSADRYDGKLDLSGDKNEWYTMSYLAMQTRSLVVDGRNQPFGNRAPYSYGSAASRLMQLTDGSHYGANLTDEERSIIRLWIDTSATYPGTYAALASGYHGVGLPHEAIRQRCGRCHIKEEETDGKKQIRLDLLNPIYGFPGRLANLSHPEKSFLLRAPLAKEAGGLGLCAEVVFQNTEDPLYGQILASLDDAHRRLLEGKRFDMPGFRPNEHYIREMQRFGFLPKDLKPEDPIDVYATDRAYWDSFHYRPSATP